MQTQQPDWVSSDSPPDNPFQWSGYIARAQFRSEDAELLAVRAAMRLTSVHSLNMGLGQQLYGGAIRIARSRHELPAVSAVGALLFCRACNESPQRGGMKSAAESCIELLLEWHDLPTSWLHVIAHQLDALEWRDAGLTPRQAEARERYRAEIVERLDRVTQR
jgi:hypothetical protein